MLQDLTISRSFLLCILTNNLESLKLMFWLVFKSYLIQSLFMFSLFLTLRWTCKFAYSNIQKISPIHFYPIQTWNFITPCTGFYVSIVIFIINLIPNCLCPDGWGFKIHWLHLCRGLRPPNKCLVYDTKQFDGEFPVMLGFWGIRSTPLPLFPFPLWPSVVVLDRALCMC